MKIALLGAVLLVLCSTAASLVNVRRRGESPLSLSLIFTDGNTVQVSENARTSMFALHR